MRSSRFSAHRSPHRLRSSGGRQVAHAESEVQRLVHSGSIDDGRDTTLCPLTGEVFRDPVVAPDGRTYERAALRVYLERHGAPPGMEGGVAARDLYRDQCMRDRIAGAGTTVDGVPEYLLDPITMAPMREPVTASDGRTYDRTTLHAMLRHGSARSPFTREELAPRVYRHHAFTVELIRHGMPVVFGDPVDRLGPPSASASLGDHQNPVWWHAEPLERIVEAFDDVQRGDSELTRHDWWLGFEAFVRDAGFGELVATGELEDTERTDVRVLLDTVFGVHNREARRSFARDALLTADGQARHASSLHILAVAAHDDAGLLPRVHEVSPELAAELTRMCPVLRQDLS